MTGTAKLSSLSVQGIQSTGLTSQFLEAETGAISPLTPYFCIPNYVAQVCAISVTG